MAFRRALGAMMMVLAVATIVAAIAISIILIAGLMRQTDLLASLASQGTVIVPGMGAGGLVLLLAGRWVYGKWRGAAPIANVTSSLLTTAGALIALTLGAALIFLLVTGFSAEDGIPAILLGVGILAGVGLIAFGGRIGSSGRSYLD